MGEIRNKPNGSNSNNNNNNNIERWPVVLPLPPCNNYYRSNENGRYQALRASAAATFHRVLQHRTEAAASVAATQTIIIPRHRRRRQHRHHSCRRRRRAISLLRRYWRSRVCRVITDVDNKNSFVIVFFLPRSLQYGCRKRVARGKRRFFPIVNTSPSHDRAC